MSLTGKKFPSITVDAIDYLGDNLSINVFEEATKKGKKVLLFWYPKDFTFVCPTELHAFQEALPEFEKRNTIVIGASCDTNEVHFAWLNTAKDNGGIEGVTYPILADTNRNLSRVLGILEGEEKESDEFGYIFEGSNVTFRATYLIDEDGKVFHESVNDMPLGRNVKEYLRLIDAYAHVQKFGEVCPANWEEGKEAMHATRDGVASYLASQVSLS
ncbi:peroxiredoxin [Parapedobacter sp. ISTM3]|uniref:Thioredoxin peroxidase n=1 Tax=Parapedobacter luteus TaxID=623280 RepID=A0A1T5DGY3_9SPHI|nr:MULTISPECIES: peroxiredoxin [Parapedobacter]MBK1442030.1 peroxiredoxin [Parapedobacter sp. ISTM3]SKB70936.1 peroxiredoxin (alkyl hydroperoxide reductase subunit C) [Parapedobacter luteus]